MEEKVKASLTSLSGELKGTYYPLTGMTKEIQQKLIDDHFLFKEGDRFLQVIVQGFDFFWGCQFVVGNGIWGDML